MWTPLHIKFCIKPMSFVIVTAQMCSVIYKSLPLNI